MNFSYNKNDGTLTIDAKNDDEYFNLELFTKIGNEMRNNSNSEVICDFDNKTLSLSNYNEQTHNKLMTIFTGQIDDGEMKAFQSVYNQLPKVSTPTSGVSSSAPAAASESVDLGKPQVTSSKSLGARTFGRIKSSIGVLASNFMSRKSAPAAIDSAATGESLLRQESDNPKDKSSMFKEKVAKAQEDVKEKDVSSDNFTPHGG